MKIETSSIKENCRYLLNNANDIIQSLDENGNFRYVNKKWKQTLGYSDQEIKKMSFRDILLPEKIPHCNLIFENIKKGKSFEKIETIFLTKDKKQIPVEGNLGSIIKKGKFIETIGIFRDISQRKRIEEKLRLEKQKIEDYFNTLDILILGLDKNKKIILTNKKTQEVLGYNNKELIGKDWFKNFLKEKDTKKIDKVFQKLISGETSSTEYYENEIITKGNKEKIIAWHNSLLRDDNKKIIGVLSSGIDVTKQKEVEEKLKENEEKFRLITSSAYDAIIMMDQDGRCTYWNPASEKMFGYKAKEILGKNLHQMITPKRYLNQYKKGMEIFKKLGKGNAIGKPLELLGRTKDRRLFEIEITLSSVKINGKYNAIAIIRDISKRKQEENEIKKINHLAINRELKMIELKKEINQLLEQLKKPKKYNIPE